MKTNKSDLLPDGPLDWITGDLINIEVLKTREKNLGKLTIKSGDDEKLIQVSFNLMELKALYNLVLENGMIDEMNTYYDIALNLSCIIGNYTK